MPALTLAPPASEEEKRSVERSVEEELIQRAVKLGIVTNPGEALVRDIFLTLDLGETNEAWDKSFTATGWQPRFSDVQVPSNKIIAFYGVQIQNVDKIVTAIRFKKGKGGATKLIGLWRVEHLYGKEIQEALSDQIIIYSKEEYINIDFYINKTGTAKVILLGKVVEKVGETVAP